MKKQVNLNQVEFIATKKEKLVEKNKKENPVLNELRELRVQLNVVTAMKSEIEQLKKQINQKFEPRSKFRNRFKCDNCRKNDVSRCSHCYLCGGSDHFRASCKNSGN